MQSNPAAAKQPAKQTDLAQLLAAASSPESTPFDYIVVGSGAGGGPLAARLAEGGKRVLVLEAGLDPAAAAPLPGPIQTDPEPNAADREVYRVPGYHAAATEDPPMSWEFSVRHYDDDAFQARDSKYVKERDPATFGEVGKGGILYPRSSALGGCTAHNAMIVIKPNDSDWNRLAATTGDPSWRAETMQGYFTRIEKCLYYADYQGFLGTVVRAYRALAKVVEWIHPRWQLDRGGHGRAGWLPTSFISPLLIRDIVKGDRTFVSLLFAITLFLLRQPGKLKVLVRSLLRLQLVQLFDPNFGVGRSGNTAQPALIPISTDGKSRVGLRDRLLDVARRHPDRLVLQGGALVTRVIFRSAAGESTPRAHGVEVAMGAHLYQTGQTGRSKTAEVSMAERVSFYAKGEIILAGGTFNTPQLLMLSGIGDAEELGAHGIAGPRDRHGDVVAPIVDLPGVGRNLQDRYEIGVISQTKQPFTTLEGVSFTPGDPNDRALAQWRQSRDGLYTTNGGAVSFFLDTRDDRQDQLDTEGQPEDPDLFIFGLPVAFPGYSWGWSKRLLRRDAAAQTDERDLWTWLLLKAYTDNRGGTVKLRSRSPFVQPDINFHSFQEGPPGYERDLDALCRGVEFVRKLNAHIGVLKEEIQPNLKGAEELKDWIKKEAWGHHACGTCRLGSDPWTADVTTLHDRGAVLDSQFRVHGVQGLRVVDASVFDRIPGYFLVTPVFMISEKAADLLLAESTVYPEALQAAEAKAVRERRHIALNGVARPDAPVAAAVAVADENALPPNTVGIALSGGGIRSATYSLGVLQTLARKQRLGEVDFISTVSGGGYTGSFLGRLFTRIASSVANPVDRVQRTLAQTNSAELWWLRSHANYLIGEGRSDIETILAVIWRNLLAVHLCIGAVLFTLFAGLRWISGPNPAACSDSWQAAILCSPWDWVPLVLGVVALLPAWFGFFLAPRPGTRALVPRAALVTWLLLLAAATCALRFPAGQPVAFAAIVALLLAWLWQELARRRLPESTQPTEVGVIVRNRLTRALGLVLLLFLGSVVWVLLDSLARATASTLRPMILGGMGIVLVALPVARMVWERLSAANAKLKEQVSVSTVRKISAGVVALVLSGFLLFGLDVLAHAAFDASRQLGIWAFSFALVVSLAVGKATGFVNLSSLQAAYGARVARAFLGATNPSRVFAQGSEVPPDVSISHPDDDLPFSQYHPESVGGPLHLINVCVNETADPVSGRHLTEDKGLSMCVGPTGVSVGVSYHALWDAEQPQRLRALPVGADPESFHVLARRGQLLIEPEELRLSQWTAISGAAISTGSGRSTTLVSSLLLGLFNVRLGYWWNTRVNPGDRPGRFPPTFLNRLMGLPGVIFRTQQMILNEWRAYFPGPASRFWHLSDGGHYEDSGLYELLRRRVAFMIAVDASEDCNYVYGDMALLARRARLDFGAELKWIDPLPARQSGASGWDAVNAALGAATVPEWITGWLNPDALGSLASITRSGSYCAALAQVSYNSGPPQSWLLLLKPSISAASAAVDVRCYAAENPGFPHQMTTDQFFDASQWESYRMLGETNSDGVFAPR